MEPFVRGGEFGEGESVESFIAEAMNRARPEIYRVNPVVVGIGDTGAVRSMKNTFDMDVLLWSEGKN